MGELCTASAGSGVPQGFAVGGVQGEDVSEGVAGEGEAGVRGQDARARATGTEFMGPADLAGLVVDGLQNAVAPEAVVGARPAVRRRRQAWRSRCCSWGGHRQGTGRSWGRSWASGSW